MSETKLKEEFDIVLEEVNPESITSPEYKRKKIILYVFRTSLAILFYILLWKYRWIRWTLILYLPLNLFGLISILG